MACPETVLELLDRFDRNREAYTSGRYNETQLRREFIDPFFVALGWDVNNEQGWAESYKEVIHEDAIKIGGATKAPDYCFRIGGVRKFFLEAKKPSVNLKDDIPAAFQLRRYAWSAKLPLSILTDFEEFAVYDCRVKPHKNDKASTARTIYLTYREYTEKWDNISDIFSRDAVLKGSFDKYAASKKKKRGTAEVDDAFLKEIENWREILARNIALRNKKLSRRDLNYAVQRTIDRVIFLRICEDRGIEQQNRLQGLLGAPRIYPRLLHLFYEADDRYNSGLFHFRTERDRASDPDDLTPGLKIDDRVLKEIIKNLYYPDSPYEFSVLPADILGQVYEQFLGKVIRLTASHQAKVEPKPEVKKAGGVYYTPTYIVDYIVKNTVGKLLEGKTPNQASKLRILDPACGSGSFLIGAYQYLLDWHLEQYTKDDPQKHAKGRNPKLYQTIAPSPLGGEGRGEGAWKLTTSERKNILLNNIYGVDIDTQAVEVTKLSLLLKVLEGESGQTLENQLRLYHERALPDLSSNIKCGNSLIGTDFYDGKQISMFDDEEHYRTNAFDWKGKHGFPEIFKGKTGGFDAVIGNPPYLFITEVPKEFRRYYKTKYHGVSYRFDLYGAFIERASTLLLRTGGAFGFIIPHTLLSNDSFGQLRILLTEYTTIYQVVDIGPGVFRKAKNETMLLFFRRSAPMKDDLVRIVRTTPKQFPSPIETFEIRQVKWTSLSGNAWLIHGDTKCRRVIEKMLRSATTLGEICTINQGLRTGNNEKYLSDSANNSDWKPAAGGKDVGRYEPITKGLYVLYRPALLDAPRKPHIFESPVKIVVQEVRNISLPRRIVASLDNSQFFCLQSTNVINPREDCHLNMRYILGVLNSTPVNTFFRTSFPGNNHIPSNKLAKIPLPEADKSRHDRMVELVDLMLKLHRDLAAAKTEHDKTLLQRQIDATDRQIDKLVYELYGLTDEEIGIVKRSM